MIRGRIVGLDRLLGRVRAAQSGFEPELAAVMYEHLQPVWGISQRRTPFETGALVGTGHFGTFTAQKRWGVFMGYGPLPYAVIQHERLDFRHASGKTAKYLEGPVREWAGSKSRQMLYETLRRLMANYTSGVPQGGGR